MYFAGMLILQAMHPTGHSHRLHQIKCPSHRLQLGHAVCSLCILAAWMNQVYERSLVWVVWAQTFPGFGVPVMSEDADRHSSDTEALFAGETGDLGRGTRLWELPRGPPPPVPVNEPMEVRARREGERRAAQAISQRVSGAVAEALQPVSRKAVLDPGPLGCEEL